MYEMNDTFKLHAEFDVFYKADADPGHQRRIGGFVTTERLDKHGEHVIQKGLDFRPFLQEGWFNDNHSQATADVLGYPESSEYVMKGQRLPTGKTADKTGWFVEGYLLDDYEPADKIWNLATALQKSKRRLGFSIEGKVLERKMRRGDVVVAKALVKNVAITRCPVNTDAALEVLAKSLDHLNKGMTVGGAVHAPVGVPTSGTGAGRIVTEESLIRKRKKKKKKKHDCESCVSKSEAILFIARRHPNVTLRTAEQIYAFARDHKARGVI